jgi:hypothetical protein
MKPIRILAVAIFATLISSMAAHAGDPTGRWKFGAEGQNGRSIETVLTLNWQNNQLSGNVDNRAGPVAISNATFIDEQVAFTVVRELGRGFRKKKITLNYSGKLEGDTIKGTIQTTGRDKKPVSLPWEAQRSK